MAAKSGENWNFSIAHRILYHYHASQNFCQNGSISYGFRDITIFFVFPQKFKMAAKSGENWNFSILYKILSYYPTGQKFCPNRSISYGFWDIKIFRFSQKFKMAAKSGENWNFSILYRILSYYPTGQKFCPNRSISYGFWDIQIFFRFSQKFKMAAKSGENWNFLILYRILFYYPVSQKFCPNRSISYGLWDIKIFSFFAKMAAKSGKNWIFSISHRILCYNPMGQKFCRNRSVSYGFWDINIFCFSAKIQDGRQKWRKLKFFNCT